MVKDPYLTLGISKTATQDQIKNAYRELAKKHHPDLNPGSKEAEQKFKDISSAYELIGDPEKRTKFDRGEIGEGSQGRQQRGPFYHQTQGDGRYTFSFGQGADDDLFEAIFGAARAGGRVRPEPATDTRFRREGLDLIYELAVPVTDAVFGAEARVPTPSGEVVMKIPPRSNSGTRLRLKGRGAVNPTTGRRGDEYVVLKVMLPDRIDSDFEAALKALQKRQRERGAA